MLQLTLHAIVLFSTVSIATAQDKTNDPSQEPQSNTINFSTLTNTKQKSLQPYYEALKTATYGRQRFSVFEQLAEHHVNMGTSDSVIHYGNLYVTELKRWDKAKDHKRIYYTKAYFILGLGSKLNGLLDNAIKWHINGITEAEAAKNTEYQYKHKIGLANIYNLKDQYPKAIQILEKAIPEFEKKWPEHTPEALVYLGDANYGLKKHANAKAFYEKGLIGCKKFNDLKRELIIKLKLGTIAELENRYDDAYKLYDRAKESGLKNGYNTIYFKGTILLGKLLYRQKEYDSAMMALSIAYVNAIDRENLHYQKEILNIHRKIFAVTNDYENAYAVMTQLSRVNSEISVQQQQKIIRELEIQYETLEKEKEISSLEENQLIKEGEIKRQKTIKNAFLIGFLVILIPVIALLYVYYQKIQTQSLLVRKQEEINEQKVTALKQEQELNLIKAAVEGQDEERKRIAQELHDSIGGNLAGIKLQLASIDSGSKKLKTITHQLDETYQLVRDISHTLIPKKFKQHAFTELIQEYIKTISNTGELTIGFHPHPEESVNAIDEKIHIELFKIIQELMTNTLKHASADQVDIHLSIINNELSLLFEDNGKGFDAANITNGIGFENIKSRIDELKGTLHIDSSKNRGTVISIEIPITKDKTL